MQRVAPITLFILVIALSACSPGGDTTGSVAGSSTNLMSEDFAVVDQEDAFANIEDATFDHDMEMRPVFTDPEQFRRDPRHPGQRGCHLGLILIGLDLDEGQRQAIRAAIMAHRREVHMILEQLRAANQPLIDRANARRREIVAAYQAGDITRDEAFLQLIELNRRVREEIRTNPDNQPFFDALCRSRMELFEAIRTILNDEQQEKWDMWLAGLPGNCLGESPDPQ